MEFFFYLSILQHQYNFPSPREQENLIIGLNLKTKTLDQATFRETGT